MLERLDKILDIIIVICEILASPVVLGIIATVWHRISKKKADEEKIRHMFNNVISTAKMVEKTLPASGSDIDARMLKALELFEELRKHESFDKAAKNLKIDFDILQTGEIQDLIEKVLHARKLFVDFDVVKEIEDKIEEKKKMVVHKQETDDI